ncbi:hypothetical protein ACWC2M_27100 [Streptomyces sp. NPDC001761]
MTNDRYVIQDVLSRYVRFTDDRDADAQSALFTEARLELTIPDRLPSA